MGSIVITVPWLPALPAGLKLAALAAMSVALLWAEDPWLLAATFTLLVVFLASIRGLAILSALRPVLFMLAFALLAHGLLGDWILGLVVVLRILILMLLATLVSATTALADMLAVLDRLLAPLRWVGLSTRPVSVAITMTLRFTPMLAERWRMLVQAWRARSPRAPGWRLVAPFIQSALDDADHAALALAARGGFDRK